MEIVVLELELVVVRKARVEEEEELFWTAKKKIYIY